MPAKKPRFEDGLKARPAVELVSILLFRPLGYLVVRLLWSSSIRPEHLVLLHGLLGFWAAWLLAHESYLAAALILQLVTILDAADGQLARSRGQLSLLGRYLDTEVDFLVHLALFAALAAVCGLAAAIAGLVVLTLVLSLDYNLVLVHRGGGEEPSPVGLEKALARFYDLLFGWQDAILQRLENWLGPPPRWFYWLLANLGRSTQFVVLGVFLVLGRPCGYLGFLAATAALIILVYAIRIWRSIRFPR